MQTVVFQDNEGHDGELSVAAPLVLLHDNFCHAGKRTAQRGGFVLPGKASGNELLACGEIVPNHFDERVLVYGNKERGVLNHAQGMGPLSELLDAFLRGMQRDGLFAGTLKKIK